MDPDHSVSSDELRRHSRPLLNEVQYEDAHLTVTRHGERAAVMVPPGWYDAARKALGTPPGETPGER
jgi:prevent-host-death family protein